MAVSSREVRSSYNLDHEDIKITLNIEAKSVDLVLALMPDFRRLVKTKLEKLIDPQTLEHGCGCSGS